MKKHFFKIIIILAICIGIGVGSGVVYFNDHAWGAWGDDSAGYIYLAGRMYSGKPLIYTDDLALSGFNFFGDEKLARWLLPTHHQFINTHGVAASKYPVGLSLLMVLAAKIMHSSFGFYLLNPLLAAVNLALIYLLALVLFPKYRYRHAIGVLASFFLGISHLYYDHALAQPMREIPSITFLLLMAIPLVRVLDRFQEKHISARDRLLNYALLALAGLAYGIAIDVRETSIMLFPGIVLAVLMVLRKQWRAVIINGAVFIFMMAIALTPTILNSIHLSEDKEVFKARDKSSVVILSNINHLDTISTDNVFDNEGRFRPGKGSLPHYWDIMQQASPVPYFLAFVLLGIIFLWRMNKPKTIFLLLWCLGTLTIFALWINPYSRYILPMFPPLMLFASFGICSFFQEFLPRVVPERRVVRVLAFVVVAITFGYGYQPLFAEVKENLHSDVYIFKAISKTDLETLIDLGGQLKTYQKPVLMFSGSWQYGTSETLEAHTGLKAIRFPLEQRFDFSKDEVYTFFNQMLGDGYTLFVWIDATSSPEALDFVNQYNGEEIKTLQFTFQPDVHIYSVSLQR
ncbi:MAG: hypothetical protein HYV32_00475 [Candidatus Kerfeldbacteria bacterium]|nr:hypothetical protein [Candidatus Kerfeldbacteria bacterium]